MSNPVVQVNVTERELIILMDKVGWNSPHTALRGKLIAANADMKQAKRLNNRANKMVRKAREDKVAA